MYKVFFNDSIIRFYSATKKSSYSNIVQDIEQESYGSVNQFVSALKKGGGISELSIRNQDIIRVWDYFRSRFVEIHAAGGLVQNSTGNFLFIRRLGKWDLPKGKIEKKETPEFAAVREVEEECGLTKLKVIKSLESTFHIYRSPFLPEESNLVLKETKWFLMHYSGNETPVPQTDEDIEEVRWIPAEEISLVLENTYPSLHEFLNNTLPLI